MLNTYGPTETTVTALWTELLPDKPVTIGKPLPTYSVYILNEELRPVPQGEAGEICISGIGVACGYVNRKELTAAKFVCHPFEQSGVEARLYRTGDLGRVTPNGDIEYLGRIDSQVKIRGYRIELAEIEAVLLENLEVENAIVSVVSGNTGVQELAAYITLRHPVGAPETLKNSLHTTLRSRLPSYMIPAFIEILDAIPTLPNGKADRSKLPAPTLQRLSHHSDNHVPPATPLEQELANSWSGVFGRNNISVEEDFFNDLGGHSLFAAQVISNLRKNPTLQHLSIADLYLHSTIRDLACHIQSAQSSNISSQTLTKQRDRSSSGSLKPNRTVRRHSNLRVWLCGGLQMVCLYLLFALLGTPSALLISQSGIRSSLTLAITSSILITSIWILTILVLPIAAKWLLIPMLAPILRLFGAKIGRRVYMDTTFLTEFDLVRVGDDAAIGSLTSLQTHLFEDRVMKMSTVRIGQGCTVGPRSVVLYDSVMEAGSKLDGLSLVMKSEALPSQSQWQGIPAGYSNV